MGSDFSFADLGTLDRVDFTATSIGEELLDGKNYVKVEFVAKGPTAVKKYGYGKVVRWINVETATSKKSEYYDGSLKMIKRLTVNGQHLVDGKYWQFASLEMANLESGGKTVWEFVKSTNLPDMDDKYFSLRYLERGR